MDAFTKRNHYNPCFWTAYWNQDYFAATTEGRDPPGPARDQIVFALNLRADKVLKVPVRELHYDKGLGVAEITPDSMLRFCKRWFPSDYRDLEGYVQKNPETLYIDFEETLAGIEEKGGYDALIEAVKIGGLSSVQHKGFLTCVIVIHALRSHEMMNSMVESTSIFSIDKWEYFWLLKNALGNPLVLARAVTPLAFAQWILYQTDEHRFPLCDSPVMVRENTLMVVLSPRLLLEINLNVESPEDQWLHRDRISNSKFREFRRRSIMNTFKEIIFHDREEMEQWRRLPEYKARVKALNNPVLAGQLISEAANRIIWATQGFGRVSQDFENKIRHFFNA